ncbi:MAG: CinA family nicotinamide mononucleotide deamidase-related protein [Rikenellaceae bacterium]|jgi:nicotinamide-nucleotide amidase|nr:CinA family nicotinamide mononucleotide deamidase-related protein [Rikenellaceae bacterium]
MRAEIITIGDELLIGQVLDTNSQWIAARLNEASIAVVAMASVGDSVEAIRAATSDALGRSEITIITGGLGPTKDDITKSTLASLFGMGMRLDRATLDHLAQMLERRGVDLNEGNRSQAMVPDGCEVLQNLYGTAPGMWFSREGRVVVSLPGVPFEMKELMMGEVLPRLRSRFAPGATTHRTVLAFGLAESMLAERIAPWEDALPDFLRLAYLPGSGGVRLRLSACSDMADVAALPEINRQFELLAGLIPEYFVGRYNSVAEAVASQLTAGGLTIAVAESCTGGAASAAFTAMSGASQYFRGGVVAYSNDIKVNVLGVSSDDLARYGAVSRQVAEQMAVGVRRLCGSDCAIATTGVAGPSGGSDEKPVGTVWVAAAVAATAGEAVSAVSAGEASGRVIGDAGGADEKVVSQKLLLGTLREQNIARAAASAINLLRVTLAGHTIRVEN